MSIAAVTAAMLFGSPWAYAHAATPTVQRAAASAARTTKAPVHASGARQRNALTYDWQSLGHDHSHVAYENDPNMNVTIAPTLGVHWMTNLLSADAGGPTIAFNPTLNKTVIYAGDQRGNLSAIDESNGQTLWSTSLSVGGSIYGTPLVSSDESSVWVGSMSNSALYKLNAATGAIDCSVPQTLPIQASPTEGTASDGTVLIYISTIGGTSQPGPELAFKESDCTQSFSSNPYKTANTGALASASYGVDAQGRRLVFQGTAHPDSTEYAIDATTGALDWSYVTDQQGTNDIAAAATVSAPGNNGFADGVVYVIDKNQICYALDLTTGKLIWQYNFGADAGTPSAVARSSAALDGNTLVFGMGNGAYALNATTGAKIWHFTDSSKQEVISNPAIVGPPGQEVVALADLSGEFHVLRLTNGAELYHYQTGNYITASPAYVNGHFLIASTDGFLYDLAANGGNGSAPKTNVTSPTQGSSTPYSSSLAIQGAAADAVGVNAVQVAVQSGGPTGPWYDLATNSWTSGAVTNSVAVTNPGSTSSNWTFSVPVPVTGTTFRVYANAVNVTQQADVKGAQVSFSVGSSNAKPQLTTSAVYVAPGAKFNAKGSGFNPSEQVSFSLAGTTIGTAAATAKGTVSASLTLPASSQFGAVPLIATGATSKKIATAPIYIANAWLQTGNGATHPGFEANDPIFAQLMSPGGNTFLARAWYYAAGAPVESSPAVYEGATFFGNDAGKVAAVGTDTAAPIWTHSIPSGAAIRSAPAIDPTMANLIFTADDGSVYVVSASSGASVGSANIGGLLTSPTVNSGRIFVGSDKGTVTALAEQTGATIWSQTLKGAVHTTPALDSSSRIVVIGDDTGTISGFNSASGLLLWQVTTGGAVTVPPTIVNGVVYVGSSDQHLYAINESTGVRVWTYSAGTTISTGAAYDPNSSLLYIGLTNGRLDAVAAANGTLAWSTVVPKPFTASSYVGVAAASSAVFGTNTGGALTTFNSSASGQFNSDFQTGAALTTTPAINDGTVYVGASDGGVYAFTPYGSLPQKVPPSIRQAATVMAASEQHPAWTRAQPLASSPVRPFAWVGQRDVALHIDTIRTRTTAAAGTLRYHGGPLQTAPRSYAIFWKPAAAQLETRYMPAVLNVLKTSGAGSKGPSFGGAYLDTTPYPTQLSDGAVQTEIAKAIAYNHWTPGLNAQFIVLTANGAFAPNAGFCSYHSAFSLVHDRSKPVVYAVVPYSGAAGACATPAGFSRTGDPAIDAVTANLIRVQRELTNDPLLNGWSDLSGGETGPAF